MCPRGSHFPPELSLDCLHLGFPEGLPVAGRSSVQGAAGPSWGDGSVPMGCTYLLKVASCGRPATMGHFHSVPSYVVQGKALIYFHL